MVFKLDNYIIVVRDEVLEKLFSYEQKDGEFESGGILLGGFVEKDNKYIITNVSEPNDGDESGPCFFVRKKDKAQLTINEEWEDSCGKINYLGEWHTHNSFEPQPSLTDIRLLEQIIKDKTNCWDKVFMIIVGRDKSIYLGMANNDSKGKIVSQIVVKGDCK